MRSKVVARIATAAVLMGGVAAGAAATAPSASALAPGCYGNAMLYTNYGVLTSPLEVYAQSYTYWNGCTFEFKNIVTISKYVTGTGWEEVAEGEGVVTYSCTAGPTLYTTNVTPAGEDFTC
jgi:hypothetical protein